MTQFVLKPELTSTYLLISPETRRLERSGVMTYTSTLAYESHLLPNRTALGDLEK